MQFFTIIILANNILALPIAKAAGGGSLAIIPRGRSQSMNAASRQLEFKPIERTRAEPELGSTSTIPESDSHPSTSGRKEIDIRERESLISNAKRVHFPTDAELTEISQPTNEGSNFNPVRDGFYARLNRLLYGSLAPAVVGTATGLGAAYLANSTFMHTATTTTIAPLEYEEMNIIG